jgi:alkylation response protein AidB-like acyl-CoA dehydrogenase
MRFNFTEDQLLLQQTVREFLEGECTVEHVRSLWETETGHSPEFWAKFAEIGVPGMLVPEAHDGLGMDEIDLVLLLEEAGRAAFPAPVISTATVAVPLIAGTGASELCERWLPKIAAGEAIVAVGHAASPFVSDAHIADLLLLPNGDEVHAVAPDDVELTYQRSNDPSRRLFSVDWKPADETRVADGAEGSALWAAALDRGALACAAQQLGVGQKLIDMAVDYACQRKQFGVPIGTFQAIKHMLANDKVRVEYARSVVYRAAHSVARGVASRSVDVSTAKVAASEAAVLAAKTALQVQGALGYTWEQDLHIWMRRAWSLDLAWGDGAWHRARVADAVIDGTLPAETFGYSAPGV